MLQLQRQLLAQVTGIAERGQCIETAVFTENPFALEQLPVDGLLFPVPVIDAQCQQDHAQRHGAGFHPVVPVHMGGQLNELVQHVLPVGEKDKRQPTTEQPGDPAGGAAVEDKEGPHQRQQGRPAFSGNIQPGNVRRRF